ncbi:MAG: HAMP domain-containing sensor histidine kinase [Acinetobacter sp.]|uniref:sensor histidine kinase n=1 Tax=Acinetobacter sp. TaxID=472 RepID=UPI003982C0F7
MANLVSLQSKLVKTSLFSSMVAGMLALLLFVAISLYQTMQVQDQLMDEVSDMLLISDVTRAAGQQVDELSDEFDIQYLLKDQHQVLTQSKDFYIEKHSKAFDDNWILGYHFIWQDQQLWRTYVAEDSELKMSVWVMQPIGQRFKELAQNMLLYGVILILLWLIQWGILHYSVKRQFKIIHQLSKDIAEKNADDLAPIQQKAPQLKELQPMVWQLNQLLQRLQQSLLAEQRFTADASHELRSPLSAIQMRLQVLKRKYPDLSQDLVSMQNDVNRGTQVLENLLLLARLDPTNTSQLPKTQVNLQLLVKEVLGALQPFSLEKKTDINSQVESQLFILANEKLLFSCLRNLIDNAIRYTPINGQVMIQVYQHEDKIMIRIDDNGQGVTPEVLTHLGERFYRVLGTKTQGSGLGISICKKIIDLHQGDISFSQSSYGGLSVLLQLPLTIHA